MIYIVEFIVAVMQRIMQVFLPHMPNYHLVNIDGFTNFLAGFLELVVAPQASVIWMIDIPPFFIEIISHY